MFNKENEMFIVVNNEKINLNIQIENYKKLYNVFKLLLFKYLDIGIYIRLSNCYIRFIV